MTIACLIEYNLLPRIPFIRISCVIDIKVYNHDPISQVVF